MARTTETKVAVASADSSTMSQDDLAFLVDCLLHPKDGAALNIDSAAVAEKRGQKNPASVANRIARMRKKYNLNITGYVGIGRPEHEGDKGKQEGKTGRTPDKNKVRKTIRARVVRAPKPAKNENGGEDDDNEEGEAKDDEMKDDVDSDDQFVDAQVLDSVEDEA